jgi:outer membrane protein TolC
MSWQTVMPRVPVALLSCLLWAFTGCRLMLPYIPDEPIAPPQVLPTALAAGDPAPRPPTDPPGDEEFNVPRIIKIPEASGPRELTLREALGMALANSAVVRTLDGGNVSTSSTTGFDPAIQQARFQSVSAIFDPVFSAGYIGSRINEPPSSFFGPGIPQPTRRDEGDFAASLSKPWASGAVTSVAYNPPLGYLFLPLGSSALFNPKYGANVEFFMRQPLLKGAGLAVNYAPIRIAQLKAEQSSWDFKQAILAEVRSVEEAYWNLQAAYAALDAVDAILPLAEEVVRIEEERYAAELVIRGDVARAQAQLDQFRQQRIDSRATAMQRESRLRNLLGLEPVDGTNLIPTGQPIRAPLKVDPYATVVTALENQPDLVRQRLAIRVREMELLMAQNGTQPQFDLQALYRTSGLGQNLDDALQQMSQFAYTDWTLGATMTVPLGRRAATANLRAAELTIARERALLRRAVQTTAYRLGDITREMESLYGQYEEAQRRVGHTREWLESARIRFSDPPATPDGYNSLLLALNDYLLALRSNVDAQTDSSLLLARYNGQLARLEEARGDLLESHNIWLQNDPCAAVQNYAVPLYGLEDQAGPDINRGAVPPALAPP